MRGISAVRLPVAMFCLIALALAGGLNQTYAAVAPALSTTTPLEATTDIKEQPLALLAKFPRAGAAMARYVAQVLTREPSTIDSILSIISDASPEQASAIGAGLVRGTRALQSKQSGMSRAIAAKVGKSDNRWLKTTFRAIGPNYRGTFTTPIPVIPPDLTTEIVGMELPGYKGRVGPMQSELVSYEKTPEDKDKEGLIGYGMIVAIVTSDAPSNGAVSTSPTI